METQKKPTAAFVLSFIGGILILIGGTLEFIEALAASVVVSSLF
jgi:hypothetical protein